ncbi:MAG: hypothetical protein J6C15_05380 [Bacteroidaceae bacterium]|nr:hypothetical protein [Bacteroidaceae bacterium]
MGFGLLKRIKTDLDFFDKYIIFVIAKREPLQGSRFFCLFAAEKMGIFAHFFCGAQFFFGLYQEKFGKSCEHFCNTEEKLCTTGVFLRAFCASEILNFLKSS